ncbi:uncharacterized protein LOC112569613 isoform X2 [Pomacea canaliculata]|uniref:uncharacterized protein LOC112569613 isoform X2 n=1 Tax=Pomacea canaliculata TaxID=400727 RepID=UPI000D72E567|nr:uncharacterized protein LOC112569613 isoform X2 [Pomacea canaliculata]
MWENFDMAEKIEEDLAVQKDGNLPQESRVCETVSFVQIKTQAVFGYVPEKCYFSACLLDGVITVVSGQTDQGQLRSTIESIDIETGDRCCEPIDFEGLVACDLHVLNVPQVHLMEVPGENQESSEAPDNTSPSPPVLLNSATDESTVTQPQEM